jgi:hypothetical protein
MQLKCLVLLSSQPFQQPWGVIIILLPHFQNEKLSPRKHAALRLAWISFDHKAVCSVPLEHAFGQVSCWCVCFCGPVMHECASFCKPCACLCMYVHAGAFLCVGVHRHPHACTFMWLPVVHVYAHMCTRVMCIHVCSCVHVCTHVCVLACLHMCWGSCKFIPRCACVCMCARVCTRIYFFMHVHNAERACVHVHTWICLCLCVCECLYAGVCVHAWVFLCMCVCACACMYICTCLCIRKRTKILWDFQESRLYSHLSPSSFLFDFLWHLSF